MIYSLKIVKFVFSTETTLFPYNMILGILDDRCAMRDTRRKKMNTIVMTIKFVIKK